MAKILVVDDEKSIVDLLRMLLVRQGYDVTTAMDGRAGLAAAKQENPDLIILDVMMPQMDGFTVSGLLFQDPVLRKTPVIILTGQHQARDILELVPNVRTYMMKPFDPTDLLHRIETLLQFQPKAA